METPNFISVDDQLININAIASVKKIVEVLTNSVRQITIELISGRSIVLNDENAEMVAAILDEYAQNRL